MTWVNDGQCLEQNTRTDDGPFWPRLDPLSHFQDSLGFQESLGQCRNPHRKTFDSTLIIDLPQRRDGENLQASSVAAALLIRCWKLHLWGNETISFSAEPVINQVDGNLPETGLVHKASEAKPRKSLRIYLVPSRLTSCATMPIHTATSCNMQDLTESLRRYPNKVKHACFGTSKQW